MYVLGVKLVGSRSLCIFSITALGLQSHKNMSYNCIGPNRVLGDAGKRWFTLMHYKLEGSEFHDSELAKKKKGSMLRFALAS